ncbi:MAG: flavin reductase family protein [Pseudomonadota bacterium]
MTSFEMADLEPKERYKLLVALVVPRPIALVSTVDAAGLVNAAPFSFFNVFSEDPPLVVLGLERKAPGALKDTTNNIAATGEFVVNLVDEGIAAAMNVCAVDFPPEVSELGAAGLTTRASRLVRPPHIAEAPANLECRHYQSLEVGRDRRLVIGEVVAIHTRGGLIEPSTLRLDWQAYRPVGRLFADLYCRTGDVFAMERQSHEAWQRTAGRTTDDE